MASTTFSGPVTSTNGFIGAVTGNVTGNVTGANRLYAGSTALYRTLLLVILTMQSTPLALAKPVLIWLLA
jgi:hypothetical protein